MNMSGITPVDTRLLVLPDPVQERTKGGILLPEKAVEADKFATTQATIIAIGGAVGQGWNPQDVARLQPGARVAITRYCGYKQTGADQAEYWIIQDKDVQAVLEAA